MEKLINKIISDLKSDPRDLKTIPVRNAGIWFYTYEERNNIYVECARTSEPSSRIKKRQKLNLN